MPDSISILRETLLPPLSVLSRVVKNNSFQPILKHIYLKTEGPKITLVGSDSNITVSYSWKETEAFDDCCFLFPGVTVFQIIKSFSKDAIIEITFNKEKGIINIVSGNGAYKVNTLPVEDYTFPSLKAQSDSFLIDCHSLHELLLNTHFAMANGVDARTFLCGTLFEIIDGQLNCVTSDGHRLSQVAHILSKPQPAREQPTRVIVPQNTVLELLRVLKRVKDDEKVQITIYQSQIKFYIGSAEDGDIIEIISNLIEGEFPQWENLFPEMAQSNRILVKKTDLMNVIKMSAIVSKEGKKPIVFTLTPKVLVVNSKNHLNEESTHSLSVEYNGAEQQIGFNHQYILDALGYIYTDMAEMFIVDGKAVIRNEDGSLINHIIMCMKS